MGWMPSSFSFGSQGPKRSSDGGFEAPGRDQRAHCWEARDEYFRCLDRHDIVDAIKNHKEAAANCEKESQSFEQDCATSWVSLLPTYASCIHINFLFVDVCLLTSDLGEIFQTASSCRCKERGHDPAIRSGRCKTPRCGDRSEEEGKCLTQYPSSNPVPLTSCWVFVVAIGTRLQQRSNTHFCSTILLHARLD